jgi:hypothetical protein
VKAATVVGHTVVLGDLNARLKPAEGPDKFTRQHGAEARQEYHEALDELAGEVGQAGGDLEALAAATVQAILAAARQCIGQKRIVSARTKAWMTAEIDLGILERRQLHAGMKRTHCPRARAAYESQKAWVLSLVKARKEEFKQEAAVPINAAYADQRNERSTNGEKEVWGKIQRSLDPKCRKTSAPQAVTNQETSKLRPPRWASWRPRPRTTRPWATGAPSTPPCPSWMLGMGPRWRPRWPHLQRPTSSCATQTTCQTA